MHRHQGAESAGDFLALGWGRGCRGAALPRGEDGGSCFWPYRAPFLPHGMTEGGAGRATASIALAAQRWLCQIGAGLLGWEPPTPSPGGATGVWGTAGSGQLQQSASCRVEKKEGLGIKKRFGVKAARSAKG